MGSLMAGWKSPVSDPKSAKHMRSRSFTKKEIEAYWRSKKKIEEEHLKYLSVYQESTQKDLGSKLQKSISLPPGNIKEYMTNIVESETETETEKIRNNGWWTRSNWAFLNEPPLKVTEGPYKYASQYHLTNFSTSEPTGRLERPNKNENENE